MAENSSIEWTDHTFNPWIGCTKISPGCDHCYAEQRMGSRLHVVNWGAGQPRKRTSASNWEDPIRWNKKHDSFFAQHGRRQRVFCASLADVFDNEVPEQWRVQLFDLIYATPNLDWLLLTKRIGNAASMLPNYRSGHPMQWCNGWPNVWIGATVVNQEEADRDIPKLLQVPAAVHFLSMEPLLGSVDLRFYLGIDRRSPSHQWENGGFNQGIDWVIVGGESGSGARPMHLDWARTLRDQCAAAGVPFLFKQWGEYRPARLNEEAHLWMDTTGRCLSPDAALKHMSSWKEDHGVRMIKLGKKTAGRELDCSVHDGYPTVATVQQTETQSKEKP